MHTLVIPHWYSQCILVRNTECTVNIIILCLQEKPQRVPLQDWRDLASRSDPGRLFLTQRALTEKTHFVARHSCSPSIFHHISQLSLHCQRHITNTENANTDGSARRPKGAVCLEFEGQRCCKDISISIPFCLQTIVSVWSSTITGVFHVHTHIHPLPKHCTTIRKHVTVSLTGTSWWQSSWHTGNQGRRRSESRCSYRWFPLSHHKSHSGLNQSSPHHSHLKSTH